MYGLVASSFRFLRLIGIFGVDYIWVYVKYKVALMRIRRQTRYTSINIIFIIYGYGKVN